MHDQHFTHNDWKWRKPAGGRPAAGVFHRLPGTARSVELHAALPDHQGHLACLDKVAATTCRAPSASRFYLYIAVAGT